MFIFHTSVTDLSDTLKSVALRVRPNSVSTEDKAIQK